MKKFILLFTAITILISSSFSQPPPPPPGNYPYFEDFESFSGFGGTVTGWSGSTLTLQSYSNHGTDGSIGMARNVFHSSNLSSPESINIVSPIVSSLTTTSELRFDYRIVSPAAYPSTAGVLPNDASIIISIGNAPNYTTIYTINASNHTQSTDFSTIVVPLLGYNGASVTVKFEVNRGTNCDYWVDIDNFRLNNAGTVNTFDSKPSEMDIFYNQNGINIYQTNVLNTNNLLNIFDVQGKLVNTFTIDKNNYSTGNLNLPKGIYFAHVQTLNKSFSKKIFIH
jgi:hypothetical protein